jgi:hypothetical protein
MKVASFIFCCSLIAIFPSVAVAHGEEAILFPVGTIIALLALAGLASLFIYSRPVAIAAYFVAIAVSIPFWIIPGDFLPISIRYSGLGNFCIGFIPSFIFGSIVLYIFRRKDRTRHGT